MTTTAGTKTFTSQWIGGDWTPSDARDGIAVIDPSDETTLAVVPAGTATDARRAVAAATSAAGAWPRTPVAERIRSLDRRANHPTAPAGDIPAPPTHQLGTPVTSAPPATPAPTPE